MKMNTKTQKAPKATAAVPAASAVPAVTKTPKAAKTPKPVVEKAPKKTPRIELMRQSFETNVLPNIGKTPNKVLRRAFINEAMALGASDASGASMYNVIQKGYIDNGTITTDQVGRGQQAIAKAAREQAREAAKAAAAELAATSPGPWTVINKETRAVVADYATKVLATEARGEGEIVVKTSSLQAPATV